MMETIYFRKKPLLILVGLSVCLILWMVIQHYKRMPPERSAFTVSKEQFVLETKPFRILSGSIHYFRVVPEYWRDRLRKLKAMGLNTVQTYVPWNLHEEIKGQFNFEGILDIVEFIRLAQSVGLYVIIRPGPYICAEWDLGGLPSWLLHDPNMKLRSMYPGYIHAVAKYFKKLLPILVPLQYSLGGPIIAFQVENEYSVSYEEHDLSKEYMAYLKKLMTTEGISELLFTSDGIWQMEASFYPELPGVLKTANFQSDEISILKRLKKLQPDKPLMVAEFWPGWFDHWGEGHHKMEVKKVKERVSNILRAGASINFYMFHGGTNFGFMNGASSITNEFKYQPGVTSYDYDALLSEAGDITEKFQELKEVIEKHNPNADKEVSFNEHHKRTAYGKDIDILNINMKLLVDVEMQRVLQLGEMLRFFTPVETENVMPMEQLPINNNGGQGYGFILYQKELDTIPREITIHNISDRAQVFLDFQLIHTTDSVKRDKPYIDEKELWKVTIKLEDDQIHSEKGSKIQLDILVENMGRVNFYTFMNKQRKGILGDVLVDGKNQRGWKIYPMDFKGDFFKRISKESDWTKIKEGGLPSVPSLYRGTFEVTEEPKDTFLHMKGWTKGVCFINGHNLGRYWQIGPQETLYLPAPWLNKGHNELLVFELEKCELPAVVSFVTEPKIIGEAVFRQ